MTVPVKRMEKKLYTEDAEALKMELLQEWNNPTDDDSKPIILEEGIPSGSVIRIYVIWDKWDGIDRTLRGEVIMDAMEERYVHEYVHRTTLALGLTKDEADRLRIKYK
jgi:hypothetical protein